MTINQIIRETITTLNKKRIPITPEHYYEAFCAIAKERGVVLEDCRKIERFIEKLNPTIQSDIAKYNIQTLDQLLTYLVSALNRATLGEGGKKSLLLVTLVKRLLQSITLLHDRKATELANASLERIEYLADYNTYELIKEKWFDFLSSYDDAYMDRLRAFCDIKSNDLEGIVDEMIACLQRHDQSKELEEIASILVAALTPSIASAMDDELASVSYELRHSPSILTSAQVQEEIKEMIKRRIELDRSEMKERARSLDTLLEEVSQKIILLMDKSHLSREKIKALRTELSGFDESRHDFPTIQQKLMKIANSLEVESEVLGERMRHESEVVKALQQRVKKLEAALEKAKKETRRDFLTLVLSRRALDEELNIVEKSFQRYKIGYSVCFFDIDHFKMINDTFGHEAGDLILKNLGKLFNELKRDVDIVGRYGGEEFLAILPNTPLEGALVFAEKIRARVEAYPFSYKGERVEVTISAGVAERAAHASQQETINEADQMLYKAKNGGRNRVYPPSDNG